MFLPVVNIPIGVGPVEPVAIVYPTATTSWDTVLEQIIEELTNKRLPPSRILLICPNGPHEQLASAFNSNRDHLDDRLRATTHVAVAPYDLRGCISESEVINLWQDDTPWVTDDLAKMGAAHYLAELTRETNSILYPPPGYQFRKLSGNTSNIFLRAGNMAQEMDSLNAISHMLLRHWRASGNTIYIDSFTILSYALGLQKTISNFCTTSPAVENFHSYGKNDNLMFPAGGDYLVVISASTSGALADNLVRRHGADRHRIVHILGAGHRASSSTFQDSCLHFLDLGAHIKKVPGNIVISGEEFIPSYSEPRAIELTKDHVNKQVAKRYKKKFYQHHLRLQHSGSLAGYGSYSLFSTRNKSGAMDCKGLNGWIVGRLVHQIPASVSLIVHLNDNMSCSLARKISKMAGTLVGKECLPLRDLSAFDGLELKKGTSVLVVAYEDPNLDDFTAASTILRKWPEAHRHFVLAYGFPETKAEFDSRKRSLTRGTAPHYGWSEFLISEVGRLEEHLRSFDNYPVDLRDHLDHHAGIAADLLDALRSYANCSEKLFLPKLNGDRMTLRRGSVFVDGRYDHLTDEVVYLTVATAIQRAREADDLEPHLRFDSNPFVASVIDPQMFSRFSDGILQAALLRSLHPSELDFSGSTPLSRQVREVLVAVVDNGGNVVGEAVLEFVAALAVEKIRIKKEDRQIVVDTIRCIGGDLAGIWGLFREENPF